jgi:hypothetical protein
VVVMGDLNCGSEGGLVDQRLMSIIDDLDMVQRVTRPTHRSANALAPDSLLDVVFHARDPAPVESVVVEDVGISDHLLVISTLSTIATTIPTVSSYSMRDIKNLDRAQFVRRIYESSFILDPAHTPDEFLTQMMSLIFLTHLRR